MHVFIGFKRFQYVHVHQTSPLGKYKNKVKTRPAFATAQLSLLVPSWIHFGFHFGSKSAPKSIPKQPWKASEERYCYQANTKLVLHALSDFTIPNGPRHPPGRSQVFPQTPFPESSQAHQENSQRRRKVKALAASHHLSSNGTGSGGTIGTDKERQATINNDKQG